LSVLLAHYEAREGQSLVKALEGASFRVVAVESEPVRAMAVEAAGFDVVIIGATGIIEDRLGSCQRLRAAGYLGAIVGLSADSGEAARFLDCGADDFAIAPADAPEMVLRARVALARVVTRARIRWASLEIDRVHRTAHLRDRALAVTAREYALLLCLVEAAGKAVSRADLLSKVWGLDADRGSNLVEVHLSRLRDKFGDDSRMIETVRRAGYRLRP
jgi:DNA-binding response OmpR family regulator